MSDWQLELGPGSCALVDGLPHWQILHSDHYEIQVGALVARAGPGGGG